MIELMAQGIDVLGENQDELIMNSDRKMGFTAPRLIGILTGVISIGIVVLGTIITK